MRITIIGWYGTETMGDRAILAGLLSFFNKSYEKFEIKLGSLYPFFSERTINEDYTFYKEIVNKDLQIDVFNSKSSKELVNAIKESDLVVMGGGPLMDLDELFMVEYTFKKAKKFGVKTALLGCGIGPLFRDQYQRSVIEITKYSDLTILRDQTSIKNLEDIYRKFKKPFNLQDFSSSYDPAVECVLEYNKLNEVDEQKYIAVNLRKCPQEYNINRDSKNINQELEQFIGKLADKFHDREIRLIPMHYFHVGSDDRVFLNSIALNLNKSNIRVQNTNLNLKETIHSYQNAYINVGMRFHSVVLQTILSGRNYILDYTEPKKGKISGFVNDIDENGFYTSRYISLQENNITIELIENVDKKFTFHTSMIDNRLNVYIDKLKELLQ